MSAKHAPSNQLDPGNPELPPPGEPVRALVTALEEDIVLGHLHSRERLVEDQLMERFAAKRHVVRAALAELDRMGLVERNPNRGAAVTDLVPREVEHIYEMRELLEAAALERMPLPLDGNSLATLTAIQHRHDAAAAAGDLRAIFRLNIEFHRAVFAACGNPHLVAAIDLHGQKAHAVRSFAIAKSNYAHTAVADHWKIIRALETGERKTLVEVSIDHIRAAKIGYIQAYRARFEPHGGAPSARRILS
jgi:DNA-binding GntR family transcriptional regulator